MSTNDTEHTAPCPCGSGKLYKDCCMLRNKEGSGDNPLDGLFSDIFEALEEQEFMSKAEAETYFEHYMQEQRQKTVDDFHGLSSDQMHRFLYSPFESPDLVEFPEVSDTSAPIMRLFGMLTEAIGEKGLKTTAKGNLPRQFCRDTALAYSGEELYNYLSQIKQINMEMDFFDMHITRLTAQLAGLIRKYKGKFILTKKYRKLKEKSGLGGMYQLILKTYVRKYNWEYYMPISGVHLMQHSFLFTLYLLSLYGDEWRNIEFYQDCFLRAFPMAVELVEPLPSRNPETVIRLCFAIYSIDRFAKFMGLIDHKDEPGSARKRLTHVKKTPLLDKVVRFHLSA
ncbi:MAG: SEC-C domain-containing protein [Verrucomicrobia bacterium]|nr:SEC-C domain-containing protein [Verrucomicrobiota bacterium]